YRPEHAECFRPSTAPTLTRRSGNRPGGPGSRRPSSLTSKSPLEPVPDAGCPRLKDHCHGLPEHSDPHPLRPRHVDRPGAVQTVRGSNEGECRTRISGCGAGKWLLLRSVHSLLRPDGLVGVGSHARSAEPRVSVRRPRVCLHAGVRPLDLRRIAGSLVRPRSRARLIGARRTDREGHLVNGGSRPWVVIPAFHAGPAIGAVVRAVRVVYPRVVVVDDCARDDTGKAARSAGAVVLRHPINLGQGAALQTGVRYALGEGADLIVTFDADGQHRAEDIALLLGTQSRTSADVVVGSRFLGQAENIPAMR